MSCILYSYWRSSCSWRVRIVLSIKNIKYEYKAVHLVKDGGEQHKEDYVQTINPAAQVPSLAINGQQCLTQSVAICEYLEEVDPHNKVKLLPTDIVARAQVRSIVEIINSGIQPLQNLQVLQFLESQGVDKVQYARNVITKGFITLERVLSESPLCGDENDKEQRNYCVGSSISMADCFLVPQVFNARRFNVDMSKFPTIELLDRKLSELEWFKKAHPNQQPDAQI